MAAPTARDAGASPLTFPPDELRAAQRLLSGIARVTPVVSAGWLSDRVGGPVWLKCENLQRSGSFKIRGAYVRMAGLSADERRRGVVAASAGNHAQGVAVAAAKLGIEATVFMPKGASLPKVEATSDYGATVELVGSSVDEALTAARDYQERTGAVLIHPFDHRDVVAGQSTVGLEILEQVPTVRTIAVPTGGGGLLAGITAAVAAVNPQVSVVGVQAEGAAAYPQSLREGHPVAVTSMSTMADGIAVGLPGQVPFDVISSHYVPVITVTENDLARASLALMERSKQVVEPAGVAAVAAMVADVAALEPPVVAVLSGGNVDPVILMKVIRFGMAGAGRYLSVIVRLPDRPGALAQLLTRLAQQDAQVLEVDHIFTNPQLSIGEAEVLVQLETRGRRHRDDTLTTLREAGYQVTVADGFD